MLRCLPTLGVLALLLALSGEANAGLIQIQYDVTGGTFDGPSSSGAITGGSLSFQALTTGSSPVSGSSLNPVLTKLTLMGTSGYFRFAGGGTAVSKFATFTQFFASFTENRNNPMVVTGIGGLPVAAGNLFVSLTANTGVATSAAASGIIGMANFDHRFTLGGESRTVVPEPASGLLLGMGLSALAVAGHRGRVRLQTRRRARETAYSR
jgi:hypothetical protein